MTFRNLGYFSGEKYGDYFSGEKCGDFFPKRKDFFLLDETNEM